MAGFRIRLDLSDFIKVEYFFKAYHTFFRIIYSKSNLNRSLQEIDLIKYRNKSKKV